jgi:hypothetical protein
LGLSQQVLSFDESFAETPPGHFRPVAPAAYRLVGPFSVAIAFPISAAFPVSISVAISVARAVPAAGGLALSGWERLRRAGRRRQLIARFDGFSGRGVAAVIPAAAAPWLTLAAPFSHRVLGVFGFAQMAIEILRRHVGDMEKSVASHGEIDKGRLDGGLEVDDLALVDVARVTLVAASFDVELLEGAILDDGDPAFLGLEHVDQHFFLHAGSFPDLRL